MNSPYYIGVVIRPDNAPGKQIETVAYGEVYSVVERDTMHAWQDAQAHWGSVSNTNKTEPPMFEIYVNERRNQDDKVAAGPSRNQFL